MNIKKIPVDLIDVGERLRSLDPVYVAEIAASFEDRGGEGQGQIEPIELREATEEGRYRLISGDHRLAAARLVGWKTIQASIVRCTNDEARLREIDENLVRRDLTVLDRAKFVAERETTWKLLHPDSVRGRAGASARWHASAKMAFASHAAKSLGCGETTIRRWVSVASARWHASAKMAFASHAAKSLGCGETTIRRWVSVARATERLQPPLRDRIAASDLANKQTELLALAAIEDPELLASVVDRMLSGAKDAPRKVAETLAGIRGDVVEHVTGPQAELDAFIGRWAKYGAETRRLIAEFVARETKPARRPATESADALH